MIRVLEDDSKSDLNIKIGEISRNNEISSIDDTVKLADNRYGTDI